MNKNCTGFNVMRTAGKDGTCVFMSYRCEKTVSGNVSAMTYIRMGSYPRAGNKYLKVVDIAPLASLASALTNGMSSAAFPSASAGSSVGILLVSVSLAAAAASRN
mmetsp:Transcript_27168/g.43516  ORF Transcript_27168/g.43516 Transcript_27168/m.43516 type:complete len:105 (+) Transcript_27168:186-500(+)